MDNICPKYSKTLNAKNLNKSILTPANMNKWQTVDHITKTYLYNFDPLKPHFYTVKLGFTEVYIIFLISDQKHRLWVLIRTASLRQF